MIMNGNTKVIFLTYLFIASLLLATSVVAIDIGDEAPDFNLLDNQGKVFRLAEHRGEIIILFFMGYDCAPCFAEALDIEQTFHKPFREAGIRVVGINLWDGS